MDAAEGPAAAEIPRRPMNRALLWALPLVAALAAPAVAAVPAEDLPDNLNCQRVLKRGWTVCVSTVRLPLVPEKPGQPTVFFHPRHAADGDPKTAWSPGERGLNLGNLIELRFAGVRRLRYLTLWNGDSRSPKAWADNGRLRQVLIQTSDGLTDRANLAERNGVQMVVLSRPVETAWIRLIAIAATPGKRYRPFAISELQPSDGRRELDVPVVGAVLVDDWLPAPPESGDRDDDSVGRGGHSSSTGRH